MTFAERMTLYDSKFRKKDLARSMIISTELVAQKLPVFAVLKQNLDCHMLGDNRAMETAVIPWLIRQDMDFY
jgi:hypothetical protein